ncbi:MAG: ornithine cyclodeaminase [Robiginitomaculum sp.]|nr:MAG: ornithine cyclodeaminase [Robiginitomaculum sp.]
MFCYVSEQMVVDLVRPEALQNVIENIFVEMSVQNARNFPVVREQLGYAGAVYGFKSGFDKTNLILGLKSGGYWPQNFEKGIANHQSTVILFDADTGQLKAIVAGNRLTALRTAAASAISIKYLARETAETLAIYGAGGQSVFQIRAALAQRKFTKLMIANRTREAAEALASQFVDEDLEISVEGAEYATRHADVLITVVSSWEPQIKSEWVQPGTHVVCMGTDTKGKQEVETVLVARSQVFADEITQVISIGECQHAYADGVLKAEDITPIGLVVSGAHRGRENDEKITLFDSTGVGLQDLAAAQFVLGLTSQ